VREKVNERSLSADEAIGAEKIKERLVNLYAKPGKTTSDYVRELNQRTQSTNENVRMFCADLESICQ
jgi:predicted DNA-binding protein